MSQFQEQTTLEYYVSGGGRVIEIGVVVVVIVSFSLNRNIHKIHFSG